MMGGETESSNFPGLNTILIYNITHMTTYVLVYTKDDWDTVLLLIYNTQQLCMYTSQFREGTSTHEGHEGNVWFCSC